MKKTKIFFYTTGITSVLYTIPLVQLFAVGPSGTSAQTSSFCPSTLGTIADFFNYATCILSKSIIPLLVTLALVTFMYGVVEFIAHADDENKRAEGRKFMLWGVIGMFVMLSVFGILGVLSNTLGLNMGGSVSSITPQL